MAGTKKTALAKRPKGMYPRRPTTLQSTGEKSKIPEYLEKSEIDAVMGCAPNPESELLMLLQWRAGLRVSEALALTHADLMLQSETPTLRVRSGKGGKSRLVPVHPELANVLRVGFRLRGRGAPAGSRLIAATRQTALNWVRQAETKAVAQGLLAAGRKVGTHTFRHSFARHMLMHGVPINYLSRWLGHANLSTTLVYLQLIPDPAGHIQGVP